MPLLQKQLDEVEKGIENMVNAMQMGMLTKSTKKRLDDLEEQKERLESDILREGIRQNILSREQIVEWLRKLKRTDLTNDDNKRRLVDTFVNSVYLYDDRAIVSFNTREGASTLPLLNKFASNCAALGEPRSRIPKRFAAFFCFLTLLQYN